MRLIRKYLFSRFTSVALIGLTVFFLIIGLRHIGKFEYLELAAYDYLIQLKPKTSNLNPHIIIIETSEEDIVNNRWPLSDGKLAEILAILSQFKPRAIGVDIFRDGSVPPGTDALERVLKRNKNIIGVMKFGKDGVPPPEILKNTDRFGFNDIIVDPGGTVRRGLLFLDDGTNFFYSFSLRLALLYLQNENIIPQADPINPEYIKLGQTTIKPFEENDGGYIRADARGYQFLLDFQDRKSSFETLPLSAIYCDEAGLEKIKGKIVLIGILAQSVKDYFYSPLSRKLHPRQQVPGIVLHAQMISQLLRLSFGESRAIRTLGQNLEVWWILLWSVFGAVIGAGGRSFFGFSATMIVLLLFLILIVYFAFLYEVWIPLVPPAVSFFLSSTLVSAYFSHHEKIQRKVLMNLFSRHVSPEVAATIWQQRDQIISNGRPQSQKVTLTVLFSDLKGFTSIAEGMDAHALIGWLNTYMETMVQVIIAHNGVVDDYAGDGIKANFGFPIPHQSTALIGQDALNAVNCALAMEKEISRLNTTWQEQNMPEISVRVGISTGPAVAGALGSTKRLKYTTIGNTVNIAARLESFNKELAEGRNCRILISETTRRYLGDNFKIEKVGDEYLEGLQQKVCIYHVMGRTDDKRL